MNKFRTAKWLMKHGSQPQVYLFRHLEKGSVVYSQFPRVTKQSLEKGYPRPCWDNKKPEGRRDLWKLMCLVRTGSHESAVQLYQNLNRLRYMRDVLYPSQAQKWRKLNEDKRIWYSGQFRPVYGQEAVADLRESLLKLNLGDSQGSEPPNIGPVTIFWEDLWRMGNKDTHWQEKDFPFPIQHEQIPREGNVVREESALIKELSNQV
ncbi:mitochondrial 54S ribosomal protein mL67 KNAG_0M01620 [Huiozyma naganishii CBS 8797]|uniref:Large ribosomal subunit protein mL67 n=1 Tax=Huiozyma naganishii (strain ATCC MYA-139 / BCRC 22969 / CBS 8797 / KCTC 17520 / NBRC 10181 / NCYC 3082 / Yp74L-3) TaxID=1071383 RepID=J7RDV6_HUIN7|nr:hypothetical protein KNAG_0M01620 [Kazachstania naganishii CBS 8797]CCK73015.1 hypothetical protein KNAG_0M01620 [Kazachstania naganishii CBS 8797]